MKQTVVATSVASLAAAVVIVALVVDTDSPHSASMDALSPKSSSPSPDGTSENSIVEEPVESLDSLTPLEAGQNPPGTQQTTDVDGIPPVECGDEETVNKQIRERGIRKVNEAYSLLLDHLELAQGERNALISLLVDLSVAATHTPCKRGEKIDVQDRSDKIAAIIGHTKLEQFLSLEQNLRSYSEVAFVDCVLERHGLSMTDVQRNDVLQILIALWEREFALPSADAERGSIEFLEYRLAEIDERERLFFEQATSVLRAQQIEYLFAQYQRDSYRRSDVLERQKRARADPNAQALPLHYPVRSCSLRN